MKTFFLTLLLTITVVGCSSNKPVVPDAKNKVPLNSQTDRERYELRASEASYNLTDRSDLWRQIQSVNQRLALVEGYLKAQDFNRKNTVNTPVVSQLSKITTQNEEIELRGQSMVFRYFFDIGGTGFLPSPVFTSTLLRSIPLSKRVEIRGRTDADNPDDVNRNIANLRAQKVVELLNVSGVDSSKVTVDAQAAGGYLVSNDTAEGKQKNRRVEVEVFDLDPAVVLAGAAPVSVETGAP